MKIPYRPLAIGLIAVAFSALLFDRAKAGSDHYFPPVTEPLVKDECGSCHMAFSPAMLPARSWKRLMADLKNHFGDDASIDAAQAKRISDYLVANAADTGGYRYGEKLLRGVAATDAPLRISELPKWVREHRKVPDRDWRHPEVRTRANCVACHADAERGSYDD